MAGHKTNNDNLLHLMQIILRSSSIMNDRMANLVNHADGEAHNRMKKIVQLSYEIVNEISRSVDFDEPLDHISLRERVLEARYHANNGFHAALVHFSEEFNFLLKRFDDASRMISNLLDEQEYIELGVPPFNDKGVVIERSRQSVTQGSFSVKYHHAPGQQLDLKSFGDDISFYRYPTKYNPHSNGTDSPIAYSGLSDAEIIESMRYMYYQSCPGNDFKPLFTNFGEMKYSLVVSADDIKKIVFHDAVYEADKAILTFDFNEDEQGMLIGMTVMGSDESSEYPEIHPVNLLANSRKLPASDRFTRSSYLVADEDEDGITFNINKDVPINIKINGDGAPLELKVVARGEQLDFELSNQEGLIQKVLLENDFSNGPR